VIVMLLRIAEKYSVTGGRADDGGAEMNFNRAGLHISVQMPGLNELELQSRLIAEGYQIPIICITAYNDENAREQALGAGAIGYLVKPFERPPAKWHQSCPSTVGNHAPLAARASLAASRRGVRRPCRDKPLSLVGFQGLDRPLELPWLALPLL
jgi:CheY-like chemotaxis protein